VVAVGPAFRFSSAFFAALRCLCQATFLRLFMSVTSPSNSLSLCHAGGSAGILVPPNANGSETSGNMGLIGGLVGASAGVGVWWLARVSAANLPAPGRDMLPVALALFTFCVGFMVGAAIGRRAARHPERVALFSTVASGFGGAVIGASIAIGLTAAYLAAYGTWPEDLPGRILLVLAFPALGGVGWFIGAAAGSLIGLTGGALLRLLGGVRR